MATPLVDIATDSLYSQRLPPLNLEDTSTAPRQTSSGHDVLVETDISHGQVLPPIIPPEESLSENTEGLKPYKDGPRVVCTRIVFMKIGEIDTVKEQFEAEVFLQARWREKALDHGRDKWRELSSTYDKINHRNMDLSQYWQPKLLIQNTKANPIVTKWTELHFGKAGEAFIVEKRRVNATFTENLELRDFPFDYQELGVVITSELSNEEVEIKEDDEEVSMINMSCFIDEQEWTLRDYVESVVKNNVKEFTESKREIHSGICMQCVASRKSGFFVWNIILIMTIISSLSFATFSVSRKLPQSRLQLSFTLTLTGVAFRFVTNQSLPKISYLTIMDKYILYSMIFNYLVSAWHAVVTLFEDYGHQDLLDFWAFIAFIALYGLSLLIFIVVVTVKMISKHSLAKMKEERYHEITFVLLLYELLILYYTIYCLISIDFLPGGKAVTILGDSWRANRLNRGRRRVGPIDFPF